LCFQELKADRSLLPQIQALFPQYHIQFATAEKKGYSGVATLTLQKPKSVAVGCGNDDFDKEGRIIRIELDSLRVVNVYFPSGSSGQERQSVKERFMDFFFDFCASLPPGPTLIAGDFNICHQECDIHHPERHHKHTGFLPHERQWFGKLLAQGWVDTFRKLNPESVEYTWWSFRAGARTKNLGWRIDYILASEDVKFSQARIHGEVLMSDHCPVSLKL
jgi:exodeoxyribonuclease-3